MLLGMIVCLGLAAMLAVSLDCDLFAMGLFGACLFFMSSA
jgi:hypothetical protein